LIAAPEPEQQPAEQTAETSPREPVTATLGQLVDHLPGSLRSIFAAMSEGLVIQDRNGRVIEANPAAEAILGLSRDAILGRTSADPQWRAVCEDGAPYPGDLHPSMRTLRSGLPLNGQIMGVDDPRRGRRWISINASPIWGEDRSRPEAVVTTFVDVTERRRDEAQLAALSAELQDLYEYAPCGYHSLDAQGRYARINATELAWLGCTAEELIGRRSPTDFFSEAGKAQFQAIYPKFLAEGRVEGLEYDLIGANGATRRVSVSASAVLDVHGRFVRSRGVMYDISELHRSREQLRQLTREQSTMLDNEIVGIIKLKGRTMAWTNRAVSRIFGHAPSELLGQPTRLLHATDSSFAHVGKVAYEALKAGGSFRSQLEMARKGGERIWVDVSGVLLSRDTEESIWFLADITELKRYQESFERMAHLDSLTGLPNRVLLADRLEQALALARRHKYGTAVCYVDLDGFKAVNDSHGHANGDRLLQELAARMHRCIRSNDTAARLGGDEFVLVLTHIDSVAEIEELLRRVLHELAQPVRLEAGRELSVTASIGVALSPQDGSDPQELLRRADTAMYAAKRLGKNKVHFYQGAPAKGPASMH
jgi:diguanylate cyclase (GGDEF)-like protein/PAS domain S-box-containing protein